MRFAYEGEPTGFPGIWHDRGVLVPPSLQSLVEATYHSRSTCLPNQIRRERLGSSLASRQVLQSTQEFGLSERYPRGVLEDSGACWGAVPCGSDVFRVYGVFFRFRCQLAIGVSKMDIRISILGGVLLDDGEEAMCIMFFSTLFGSLMQLFGLCALHGVCKSAVFAFLYVKLGPVHPATKELVERRCSWSTQCRKMLPFGEKKGVGA